MPLVVKYNNLYRALIFLPLSPGYSDTHHHRVLRMIEAGLAYDTWKNKTTQVRKYIEYMNQHNANPLRPTQYEVISYLISLHDALVTPSAVMNYCSGART